MGMPSRIYHAGEYSVQSYTGVRYPEESTGVRYPAESVTKYIVRVLFSKPLLTVMLYVVPLSHNIWCLSGLAVVGGLQKMVF